MFKKIMLILILVLPLSIRAELLDGPLTIILVGSKDQVMSLLNESMNAEFSRGVTTNLTDQIGFKSNFQGFFTGATEFQTSVTPLVTGDSLEPTAYTLGFRWKTQFGDGKQHASSFITTIKSTAAKRGDVTIATSVAGYKLLPEQSNRCFDLLVADKDLTILKNKIALDSIDNTNFSMLADDTYPTDQERKAIALYASKVEACRRPMKSLSLYYPNDPTANLYRAFTDSNDQLILSLYKGQLSFGNFAKIRKENKVRVDDARMKIVTEAKAQDAAALDRAQRIAIEQQKLFVEQQRTYAEFYKPPVMQIPRMTSTNCQLLGNQVNCTSY